MQNEMRPWMRLEKKDLYMFLARLMEEFPECHAPSDEFNKTGIVICESDRVQKIVAMSFSKPGLHAVQQIIHCLPSSLRNCTVYLSRKPCTTCTTFLIQGSVSSVYYWPMAPEKKGDESEVKEDIQQSDHVLLKSHTSSSILLPMTSFETVKVIAKKIQYDGEPNSKSKLLDDKTEDFKKYCSLFNMHSCEDIFVKRMENALRCYDFLLECSLLEKKEPEDAVHRHALQLCYFLAARTSDPHRGVGCVLYSQDGYFFGAGYNGYPIGILYANLPYAGRKSQRNGFAKREVVLHAEANVLLYRSKPKIEESDVLYCTKPPCHVCQTLLKDMKIKTIHCVEELSKQSEKGHLDDLKKNFDYHEWKQCRTQPTAVSTDSEDNGGTEGRDDEDSPLPHLKKEDLCIYLALQMEKKSKAAVKTGIVVCEASKPKRIIALGCATEELHAVPKVLLRFPNTLKGCEVYMSRKPCNYCATLLVQAQVSQVYYWPNTETNMSENDQNDHVNAIFTESYVVAAVYVPTIDDLRKMQILNSNKRAPSDEDNKNGVGTVIYKEDNIVALGYSGYPKGSMNSLFCKGADFDQHAIVCAEANAIIMSSERDLSNAELITTRKPCHDCLKLIRAKNIAKVIWPLRGGNVGDIRGG
ncbi:cytidine and dCMP deaminase domain-containing protein 1-like [Caloenas nicobarica]|uniref:cytidine and dCMP deaminase domain-containing protein 1-like n=1 Tax=Caloenas nicobarica TaxID=187106 RepID=UPI0032B7C538